EEQRAQWARDVARLNSLTSASPLSCLIIQSNVSGQRQEPENESYNGTSGCHLASSTVIEQVDPACLSASLLNLFPGRERTSAAFSTRSSSTTSTLTHVASKIHGRGASRTSAP